MIEVHDGIPSLGRKPAINKTMHPSEAVNPSSHISRLPLCRQRRIVGVIADHRGIMIEGSIA
jgi:hypothetical protein